MSSTLRKDTLIAVVAIVVTSGMILLSESSIAETKNQTSMGVNSASMNVLENGNTDTAIQQDVSKKNIMLAPPPGPFLNEELSANPLQKKSPIAPKAPTQAAYKVQMPTRPVNSLSLKTAPVHPNNNVGAMVELKPPVVPLLPPSKPSFGNVKQHDAPKLNRKIHVPPSGGQTPNLSKSMPSSPQYNGQALSMSPPNIPIWSQKRQSANLGANNSRLAPNNNRAMMNSNNLEGGYPVQQYMYVPVPMMPSNIVAPQVPVFDRVPAPMPNYWVPAPAANKPSIQENLPKKDNN